MTLPEIHVHENVEAMRNTGYEGRNILVIGNAGFKEDTPKIYTLYNLEDATKKIRPSTKTESTGNPNILRSVIHDIFREGAVTTPNDTYGLNNVYAINIGPEPTIETLIEALKQSETLYSVEIEAYPELSDIAGLNLINGHLKKLEGFGDYRIAIATTPQGAELGEMIKMTSSQENSYISSGRVVLKVNPGMVGVFAAKVACTPYHQDPACEPYKTIHTLNIGNYTRGELEKLVDAGLVVDREIFSPNLELKVVEPVYALATNYTADDTPGDAFLHRRLNADHQAQITDNIARRYIKQNNTETSRQVIEHLCRSYLEDEVTKNRLAGFSYDVYPNLSDPFSLMVKMAVAPVNSIHTIEISRTIQS